MVSFLHFVLPIFTFILFTIVLHKRRSQKTAPPSPRKLPIFGNLHQLGTLPHRSLETLSKRYGHLMLLHFGRVPVLVVSSADAACEIMKNQDLIFSNRPKLRIPDRLLYNSKDVTFGPYGEYWRQIRRICVLQLLSNNRVQSFRSVREEETLIMINKIKEIGSLSPIINLSEVLVRTTNNIVCRVALGRKYNDGAEGKMFKKLIAELVELLGRVCIGDYIPWLSWIDKVNGLDARLDRVAKTFDDFLEGVVEEHRRRMKDGEGQGFDFVDTLLEFQRENASTSSPVEDDTIKALILDMFSAGTDTSSTVLEWAMAELIRNPKTLKLLQNEVREVAGTKQEINEDDIEKMHYLKAVIKETLRLHAPTPLLVPRESTQDTKVMGYDISSGTQVIINAWAISRDPLLWKNPEEFNPGRFLNNSSIDYRGPNFEMIPFGSGRRGCPGMTFGVAIVELTLAKLVHSFDIRLPNGEDMDMGEVNGLTTHKKLPLLVVATPIKCNDPIPINDICNSQ